MSPRRIRERVAEGEIVLLDAAMGSDLDRRGLATALPLWSALGLIERPDLVREIHADNLRAGADVIITDTFRTTGRTLAKAGLDPRDARRLDTLAVELAMEARELTGVADALIGGSIAPLEDCYSPELSPDPQTTRSEHTAQADNLAEAGSDLLMIETMPLIREAVVALDAARSTGLPATVGFVCAPVRKGQPVRLLSGELLADAVAAVTPLDPEAILVNCCAAEVVEQAMLELSALTDLPFGGYANVGIVDDAVGWQPDLSVDGARFAASASSWIDAGAVIIGGCCGTHPAHTAALRAMLDSRIA